MNRTNVSRAIACYSRFKAPGPWHKRLLLCLKLMKPTGPRVVVHGSWLDSSPEWAANAQKWGKAASQGVWLGVGIGQGSRRRKWAAKTPQRRIVAACYVC